MRPTFLHLVKRLAHATPASWLPACLQEATGYTPERLPAGVPGAAQPAPRGERLRVRQLAACGALFAAPGHPPLGGLVVLPASRGESPATAADDLRRRLAGEGRALLDAALADPRLLAHLELGAPPSSIAGAAGLQFLRDRHAWAVGHFLHGSTQAGNAAFDGTSCCVQVAGVPPVLLLWLAAHVATLADAAHALVLPDDEDGGWLVERQRPQGAAIH